VIYPSIKIRGSLVAPAKGLRRGAALIREKTALMNDAGEFYTKTIAPRTFDSNGSALGKEWLPTVDGRTGLTKSWSLRKSISWLVNAGKLVLGTPLIYGATHQQQWTGGGRFNGVIEAKNGKFLKFQIGGDTVYARRVKIPQRKFLGWTQPILSAVALRWVTSIRRATWGSLFTGRTNGTRVKWLKGYGSLDDMIAAGGEP